MRGTTAFCFALLALPPAPAMAADQDTQLWVTGTVATPLAKDVNGSVDISQRFREAGDQQLVRASLDFRLSPRLTIGGGATYVRADVGPSEFRPHQHVTLSFGRVAWRSTLEERLFDGADRAELRLRERLRLTQPLDKATRLVGTAEALYILQPQNHVAKARWDSWRGTMAVQRALSKQLDASAGYMLIYAPRPTGPDKISHVPQLSLTWSP